VLTLDLTSEDAAKAERFTESLRAARLDDALAREHIEFVREVALKDEESARLWWLHCNLSGQTPDTSWTVFTEHSPPARPYRGRERPGDPPCPNPAHDERLLPSGSRTVA